jgi:GNAT superfamily N-acetyltransferase
MIWQRDDYTITDDPARIDLDFLYPLLLTTYWANQRTRPQVARAIENSLCFTLLHANEQIGFARIITDRAVMAYLADVVIDPAYRRQGLGKWLVSCVIAHPDLQSCKIILETADAHSLYERYGFEHIPAMKHPAGRGFEG